MKKLFLIFAVLVFTITLFALCAKKTAESSSASAMSKVEA